MSNSASLIQPTPRDFVFAQDALIMDQAVTLHQLFATVPSTSQFKFSCLYNLYYKDSEKKKYYGDYLDVDSRKPESPFLLLLPRGEVEKFLVAPVPFHRVQPVILQVIITEQLDVFPPLRMLREFQSSDSQPVYWK